MAATPEITWEQASHFLKTISQEVGEWAGIPMPIEGSELIIDESYPWAKVFSEAREQRLQDSHLRVCRAEDIDETVQLRNEWLSVRYGCYIRLWQDRKGFYVSYRKKNSAEMLLNTLGASRAYDVDAEIKAVEKLRRHTTGAQFEHYFMTGAFLETSRRSGLKYMFRRLRPTVVISATEQHGTRIICTLCGHPVGYYDNSWAGAMVPTDDVIAALLLMRADEHYMWRKYEQHPAWAPESGL